MMTPKEFLLSLGAIPCSAAHEAMRLYAEYIVKEVRHQAAEIAISADSPSEAHRDIMNLQIK